MRFKRFTLPMALIFLLSLSSATLGSAGLLNQEAKKPLTNADVIRMAQSGWEEGIIVDTIEASKTEFDISVDALDQLKQAGVSQKVIKAMLEAEKRKTASAQPATNPPSPPQQPYALLIEGEAQTNLPTARTQVAQAKAKGNDLASLATDAAVGSVLTQAAATAAAHAATSVAIATGSAMAAVPILGVGVGVLGGILGRRRPTVTYVWALPGQHASTNLQTNTPRFELRYGDIPGVDPDQFAPIIVQLVPTKNNWRLVGATKAKMDVYQAAARDWEVYSSFSEGKVLTRTNKLGRGHIQVEPERPLEPGEYGLVLRPLSPKKKFSGTDVANGQGEGVLFNSVWDFSVGSKSDGQ